MMIEDKRFAELVKSIDKMMTAAIEQGDADAMDKNHLASLRCYQRAKDFEALLYLLATAVGVNKEEMLQGIKRWETEYEETIRREGYDLFDLTLGDAQLPSLIDSLQDK